MLRDTLPSDTPELLALADSTGVFKPHEIQALGEVLDDYHAANHRHGHRALTSVSAGDRAEGFAYFAPASMTDRTFELWWIAVAPECQGRGAGARLLRAAEDAVRAAGGRLLVIETSSTALYEPTRGFYRKFGYAEVATVPDWYAEGDSKVLFSKRLAPARPSL